jgi:hypothetical protein
MRRLATSLAAAGLVALSACSGGGAVLSTGSQNTADHVLLTVNGSSNIPRVLPGGSLPISATAVQGSQNGTTTINRFLWSATLVTSGSYVVNTNGGTKPCNAVTITTGATTQPYSTDFTLYVTIDPTNESNIIFSPPPIIPPPTGSTVTVNYPYCVRVDATALSGSNANPQSGATGSIIVAVVNPASPEQ